MKIHIEPSQRSIMWNAGAPSAKIGLTAFVPSSLQSSFPDSRHANAGLPSPQTSTPGEGGRVAEARSLESGACTRKLNQAAFTMVEIALSIAVVAFGLVAILGILPTGHQVQKDNREDTIINLDGNYLLEAIGSGSQGLTELSNYVESITLTTIKPNNTLMRQSYSNLVGRQIIGLLSTPKYTRNLSGIVTNSVTVTARVRAISGSAVEKGFGAPPDIAFRYLLASEVIPLTSHVLSSTNSADQRQ
jgi:type II secretory pathway pseudopilin PulG